MAPAPSELDDDIAEIQQLLAAGVRIRPFRAALERAFVASVRERTLSVIRGSLLVTICAFLLLAAGTRWQLAAHSPPAALATNLTVWGWALPSEAAVMAVLLALPWLPAFNRHFRLSISLISGAAVFIATVASSAFADHYFNIYTSYLVALVILLIYGLGGMTLWHSCIVSWLAVIAAVAVILVRGWWLDPVYAGAYLVLTNLVGMLLGYLLELRDRHSFLQSCLLRLEKSRLNLYAEEVARLSREDGLTGLANRRHFNDTLRAEWDRARRQRQGLSLVFVDIDHFKPFNDSHGHVEGDRVLAAVGRALGGVLRRPADLAARYGGEEFVLLLPETSPDGAIELAEQARSAVEALGIAHRASPAADHVTASIGVACMVPGERGDYWQLVHAADQAVYRAKAGGRNRVVVAA